VTPILNIAFAAAFATSRIEGSNVMRLLLAAFTALAPGLAYAQTLSSEAVAIGPWQIEATYRGSKFERCVMRRRTEEGVEVRFQRDARGLALSMNSPRWRLEPGKSYPVELIAGTTTFKANMAATRTAVSLPIEDERFLKVLRLADGLDVKGAGSTIPIALDKSAAGLERLETCYTKNAAATETNPFATPSRKP